MNNKWKTLKSFIRQNRPIDVAPEHCFDVTLGEFEHIINSNFIQLEAEWLNGINYFLEVYKKNLY